MKTQRAALVPSEPQPDGFRAAGAILLGAALIGVSLAGCGKTSDSSGNPPPLAKQEQGITPATTPAMQSALTAWEQGDTSVAVSRFLEADWSARPLFAPGSTLSLSEEQFMSLARADRNAKQSELITKVGEVKRLGGAVLQAGRDTAAKKDHAQARKHISSVKQCGEALQGPESMAILQQTGRALTHMADDELAKLGQ
jgi:hypothetical protein